jgi:hypothetical protein
MISRKEATQIAELAAQRAVQGVLALLPTATAPAESPDLEGVVERAIHRALDSLPTTQAKPTTHRAPDEPMFIPSGIVGDDETDLQIESESSEGDLEDAAAALKRLRKGDR